MLKSGNNRQSLKKALFFFSILIISGMLAIDVIKGKPLSPGPLQLAGLTGGISLLAAASLLGDDESCLRRKLSLFFLPLAPFFIWVILNYLSSDLWYDEVYTLDHFVLKPLIVTLTDYHSTNNHIFFNIINHFYLKLLGIQTFQQLLPNIEFLRLLMLVYTTSTLIYVYRIANRYFNRTTALLSILILATTIPFYNFSVQIRGYNLSMLLLTMLLYHGWRMEENPGWKKALLLTFLSALLLYTLPTNIYALAAFGLIYMVKCIARLWILNNNSLSQAKGEKTIKEPALFHILTENPSLQVILSIAAAGIPVILFYLPVFDQLMNNPNAYIGLFNSSILYPLMPQVLSAFLSERWLLLVLIVIGIYVSIRYRADFEKKQSSQTIFLINMLILPFIVAYIHGYIAFDRIFVVLTPVFALVTAVFTTRVIDKIPALSARPFLSIFLIALYCYASFAIALQKRDQLILQDIQDGHISQDLINNVYQAYYRPQEIFRLYIDCYQLNTIPLFVYDWGDISAVPLYAHYLDLEPQKMTTPVEMLSDTYFTAHVISAYPNTFLSDVAQETPAVECKRLNDELSYINLFECSW